MTNWLPRRQNTSRNSNNILRASILGSETKLELTHNPLHLLRKVRDVMRSSEPSQVRLNKLVKVIAEGFDSEVCSIYFAKPGNLLELSASIGLKKQAVHTTQLAVGEGLVGDIAALAMTLNLPDAQNHPKFAYRPETGEEKFQSFIGVPVLYSHRVIGVLVVQSADAKIYSEDQIEILQTIAMVVAELAIASHMVEFSDVTGEADAAESSHYFTGLKLAPGLAKAVAVRHRPELEIKKLVSDDPEYEEQRLQKAIVELQESVDELIRNSSVLHHEAQREILETYRMFTHDQGWLERIIEAIRTGLTAEAAVKKVQEQMHARMSQVASVYMRARMMDLEDLSLRLLYHLSGVSTSAAHTQLPEAFILVASSLGPAELLEYSGKGLAGIVVEEGSAASHIAIIARMMDVPMVARIPHATEMVHYGDLAIVDGDNGEVYIRPPQDVEQAIDEHIISRQKQSEAYEATRDLPVETKDGVSISMNLNIGLYLDAHQLAYPDVDGIGLYRTELPYLASADIPDVDEQKKIYGEIFRHARGKRIIFRSFDIGGDKQVPYARAENEENPAMGWRATRIGLDRPVILRRQFRALIRAANGHDLYIMFPFIADVSEFDETKQILEREMERAKVEGQRLPGNLYVGSMIEIPSIIYQLPSLLKRVDFVSIGSNDLLQFLFACDRGSERLSGRYDPLSPVVVKVIKQVMFACEKAGVDVGFCGDMATKPIEAMLLIGCGVRNLSVPPAAVGPVKAMLRSLDASHITEFVDELEMRSDHSIRSGLEQYAREYDVVL